MDIMNIEMNTLFLLIAREIIEHKKCDANFYLNKYSIKSHRS